MGVWQELRYENVSLQTKDSQQRDTLVPLTTASPCIYAVEPPCIGWYERWCDLHRKNISLLLWCGAIIAEWKALFQTVPEPAPRSPPAFPGTGDPSCKRKSHLQSIRLASPGFSACTPRRTASQRAGSVCSTAGYP